MTIHDITRQNLFPTSFVVNFDGAEEDEERDDDAIQMFRLKIPPPLILSERRTLVTVVAVSGPHDFTAVWRGNAAYRHRANLDRLIAAAVAPSDARHRRRAPPVGMLSRASEMDDAAPSPGDVALAYDDAGASWFRGVVIRRGDNGAFAVRGFDSARGDGDDVVNCRLVKSAPEPIRAMRSLAIPCRLFRWRADRLKWSGRAIQRFQELLAGADVVLSLCRVGDSETRRYSVEDVFECAAGGNVGGSVLSRLVDEKMLTAEMVRPTANTRVAVYDEPGDDGLTETTANGGPKVDEEGFSADSAPTRGDEANVGDSNCEVGSGVESRCVSSFATKSKDNDFKEDRFSKPDTTRTDDVNDFVNPPSETSENLISGTNDILIVESNSSDNYLDFDSSELSEGPANSQNSSHYHDDAKESESSYYENGSREFSSSALFEATSDDQNYDDSLEQPATTNSETSSAYGANGSEFYSAVPPSKECDIEESIKKNACVGNPPGGDGLYSLPLGVDSALKTQRAAQCIIGKSSDTDFLRALSSSGGSDLDIPVKNVDSRYR